jgi:hypothetical protein
MSNMTLLGSQKISYLPVKAARIFPDTAAKFPIPLHRESWAKLLSLLVEKT